MKIPQFAPFIGMEEYEAIKDCFVNNWITEGPKAAEFEKKLREFLEIEYSVFAPNGTLSLYLALRAIGIKPGDEVIVPDFTFIASANAVQMIGAVPIFCDVNKDNFQIDIDDCERLITEKTRAIMPVHIYGMCCNMKEVLSFAKKYNLLVIEDAAQALGISYTYYDKEKNCNITKKAGTFGDVGSFSFFADKTLTTGEGGLIVTSNSKFYENLRYLRNQGRMHSGTFIHPEIGYNFRMTDIQMAIGLVQLKKFNDIAQRKLNILNHYKKILSDIPEITFIKVEEGSTYIPFRTAIIAKDAHKLMEYLNNNGIQPRTFFYPLHKQPCFQYLSTYTHPNFKISDEFYPNAIFGYENGVCLPSYAAMKIEEVEYVCQKIKEFYGKS